MSPRILPSTSLLLALAGIAGLAADADAQQLSLESLGAGAENGDGNSYLGAISADGRVIAFESHAKNLIPGDQNDAVDILVRDLETDALTRVSVSSSGGEANGFSDGPSLSGDGRYVAFTSFASNLVAGDTNFSQDVFVHDRQTGTTERVSVDSQGGQAFGSSGDVRISPDGRYVVFSSSASNLVASDLNGVSDVFLHDRWTGATERVSVGPAGAESDGYSGTPAVSAEGRYVAFDSSATNLVPSDTNGEDDVFLHDRQTGVTTRVSTSSTGVEGDRDSRKPSISADGQWIAFESYASTLDPIDTDIQADVFVHDVQAGTTWQISVSEDGATGFGQSQNASIAADGRYVLFQSTTHALLSESPFGQQVVRKDLVTGACEWMSPTPGQSAAAGGGWSLSSGAISADGRRAVFYSEHALVAEDANDVIDTYVFDAGCEEVFDGLGHGLEGSGGFVPYLHGAVPNCDGTAELTLTKALGAAPAVLMIGAGAENVAYLGGSLYIDLGQAHVFVPLVLGGTAGVAGSGGYAFAVTDHPTVFAAPLYLQLVIADPGALHGASLSNAVRASADG